MTAPGHVLMTAETTGGVWTYAVDLCASLARYGVKVTLVGLGGLPSDSQNEEIRALDNVELVATPWRTEWMTGSEDDLLRSGELLLQIEAAVSPDVVHLNSYWHAGLSFRAPVLVVAHSCVSSWWKACRKTPLPPEWAAYEGWISQAVHRSNLLVAPTNAFLKEFQALHGPAAAARAIPNGRSPERFKPRVKRRIVLAAGRLWDEAKNIDVLCRVAEHVDVPIVAAGEMVAPDGSIVDAGGVAALGRLSSAEMARWMGEAAIFAAPARYEPFGLSILEAALSGCALILGDIPTLRELWDGAATFVEPDDLAGLRRAIRMLSDVPQLAASDGRKARERALAYSADHMGDRYFEAYHDMQSGVAQAGEVAA